MTIELNQIHSPSNIGGISLANNKLGMEKKEEEHVKLTLDPD